MPSDPSRSSEPVDDPPVAAPAAQYPSALQNAPPATTKKGSSGSVAVLIALGAVFLLLPIIGVLSALAIYGVRNYIQEAKDAEGRMSVTALARGILRCQTANGTLPETSRTVPPELSMISGKKYMSDPGEWNDPAFRCAGFSM